MEDSQKNVKITDQPAWVNFLKVAKILLVPFALLLPFLFAITVSRISDSANTAGLFYMRPELPTLITLALFPLTWIYLVFWFRREFKPKRAGRFAGITTLIILVAMIVSTTMETASIAPLAKIDKSVTAALASEGWVKQARSSGEYFNPGSGLIPVCISLSWTNKPVCPEVDSSWVKIQDAPLSFIEVQKIAADNGLTDYEPSESCKTTKTLSSNSCQLSGKINGTPAKLSYSGNNDVDYTHWTLHLSLHLTSENSE